MISAPHTASGVGGARPRRCRGARPSTGSPSPDRRERGRCRCCRKTARSACRRAEGRPSFSASSHHAERDAVLHGPARVLALELHEDPRSRVWAERAHVDERRVAYQVEDALVECHDGVLGIGPSVIWALLCSLRALDRCLAVSVLGHCRRDQPPATAGRIEMVSPFETSVSSLSRYRTSSSFR